MKQLLTILFLLAAMSVSARSQINVSPAQALDFANNRASEFAELKARYLVGDSTLTSDEVAIVYYAVPQLPEFKAASSADELDAAYNRRDYASALPLALNTIEANPVSFDATVKALVSCRLSGASLNELQQKLQRRYDLLSMMLLSSGQGTSLQSPFVVNTAADRYRMLVNLIQAGKIVGYSDIADCSAAKFTMPDTGSREHILYFRILEK